MTDEERLKRAARDLVERLDFVHDDSQYQAVWTVSQLHIGPYRGPKYDTELTRLRTALDALSVEPRS